VGNKSYLHAFRLGDEEEQKLTWLLTRFHLESRRQKSGAIRCLVRELYGVLREIDLEKRFPHLLARASTHASSADEKTFDVKEEEEEGEKEVPEYCEDYENPSGNADYRRLRPQAVEELKRAGMGFDLWSIRSAIGEILIRERRGKKSKPF